MWIAANKRVLLTPLQAPPTLIKYGFINSTFGRLLLGLTFIQKGAQITNAICLLYFALKDDQDALDEVHKRWPKVQLLQDDVAVQHFGEMLCCDKKNTARIDIAVWGTTLQLAVWNALVDIKAGSTCTYTELAELVHNPKAVRAVASAVARNEVSILIPCHRIVSKSGALKYHWGAQLKCDLLQYEADM